MDKTITIKVNQAFLDKYPTMADTLPKEITLTYSQEAWNNLCNSFRMLPGWSEATKEALAERQLRRTQISNIKQEMQGRIMGVINNEKMGDMLS